MPDHLVLVIEDEIAIASALNIRLTAMGYRVELAHDGRSGIAAAVSKRPDVILLDIRLPDIDGIEVCNRLKAHPDVASIPVVIVSANVNDVTRGEAQGAGAAACLAKPYEIQDVAAAIESAIQSFSPEATCGDPNG